MHLPQPDEKDLELFWAAPLLCGDQYGKHSKWESETHLRKMNEDKNTSTTVYKNCMLDEMQRFYCQNES